MIPSPPMRGATVNREALEGCYGELLEVCGRQRSPPVPISSALRSLSCTHTGEARHVRPSGPNAINGPKPLRLRAVCGLRR